MQVDLKRRALTAGALGLAAISVAPRRAQAQRAADAVTVTTYLLFDGNCRAAMEFYHSILGGELQLTTVGESPMAQGIPAALHQRIVHARLTNAGINLSASDWLAPNEAPSRGNMNALYVEATPERARAIFDRLSAGGRITTPFTQQPFGWYGRVVDVYGVVWMLHADAA